jgi:imidazolonepropionase-like amidohydrolase
VSGPGLSAEGGQFAGLDFRHRELASQEYRIVRGVEDARLAVRENVTHGADLIKIYANNSPNPGYLSIEEMRAIVDEAHLLGVRVTAHATNDRAVSRAVRAGVDGIEHGYFASDSILALLAARKIPLVTTAADLDTAVVGPRARQRAGIPLPPMEQLLPLLARAQRSVRQVPASGVTMVAGSDMYWNVGLPRGEAARRVLFAYHQSGIPPATILQSATLHAAQLLGEPRLGRIAVGAHADMIAVQGDPLEDFGAIERVQFVMRAGVVVRDTR